MTRTTIHIRNHGPDLVRRTLADCNISAGSAPESGELARLRHIERHAREVVYADRFAPGSLPLRLDQLRAFLGRTDATR